MYLNKALIIGNLTRDPELKSLPSGMKVCSFSIATNRVWKDQSGAKQEAADFHNVVVFGRQAENSFVSTSFGNHIASASSERLRFVQTLFILVRPKTSS